ncbi:MAG: polymer-forming cytoskeletal protein [Haloarculaceae archaeon]
MTPTESIPLLLVVLLLVAAAGGDPEQLSVTFRGDHDLRSIDAVHVVAGGTTTLPANASVAGDLYVIGGTTRIDGTLDGDATVLAGNLSVADGAAVTGRVWTIAGRTTIADGAAVGRVSTVEPPAPTPSPARRVGGFLLQFLVLALAGWVLVRRRPSLLANVGDAVAEHALVSGVVGALGAATLLVLFVYMAFTLLLLPVAVAGLVGEVAVALYGQLAVGYLVGTRLPIARADRATVAGIGLVLLGMELLGAVPLVGAVVQLAVVLVGFGAVLNTYFGFARFEPVAIPEGAE